MNFKKIADTNFKFTFKKIISFDAANAFDISITGLKFTIFAAYLSCMGLDFHKHWKLHFIQFYGLEIYEA